jgi:hypothetical protein
MAHPRNITRSAISIACATHVKPAGVESGTKGRTAGEVSMAVLYPIRKACPACGKPMVAVPRRRRRPVALRLHRLRPRPFAQPDRPQLGRQPAEASGEVTVFAAAERRDPECLGVRAPPRHAIGAEVPDGRQC